MPEQILAISREKGVPEMEIVIGQAQYGKYVVYLWDPSGRNPQQVATGVNVDQIPDKFPVGASVDALQQCLLSWEIIISAFESGPGQLYSATVIFTQRGEAVAGGRFDYQGALEGVKYLGGLVRLAVQ